MYQLHVHVVQAVDIPKTEFLSFSDLYMILMVSTSSSIQSTNVIESTQSPIWNQEFHFSVVNQENAVLNCIVKSKIASDNDIPVSKIDIPIYQLKQYEIIDKWYDLQPLVEANSGGKCRFIIQMAPTGHPAFQPLQIPISMPGNYLIPGAPYNRH